MAMTRIWLLFCCSATASECKSSAKPSSNLFDSLMCVAERTEQILSISLSLWENISSLSSLQESASVSSPAVPIPRLQNGSLMAIGYVNYLSLSGRALSPQARKFKCEQISLLDPPLDWWTFSMQFLLILFVFIRIKSKASTESDSSPLPVHVPLRGTFQSKSRFSLSPCC